ncbi:MAG: hypothetical protein JSU73_10085 [candidate division WOR-3 bacterium]|nr:MAG: hypothetical protein JSU73_10085 [candidate division WOR-3 bacterium]
MACFSSDGGGTWERINLSDTSNGTLYALAVAPGARSVVYGAGHVNYSGRAWRSTDYGRTWAETASPGGRVYGLAVHPDDENTVYAAAMDSCWKTTDAGATWQRVGGGYYLADVCLFPGGPDTVFVGGRYGVAMSTDAGVSWASLNEGLTSVNVTCLEACQDNGEVKLFAGTSGGGLHVYSFLTGVWERRVAGVRPGRTFPTFAKSVLSVPGSPDRRAVLSLLDLAGRKVMDLRAGENDIRGVAPGVYFVGAKGSRVPGSWGPRHQKVVIQH